MSELYLTREQVRQIDRTAMERYGMLGLVLMENAGRGCADVLTQQGIRGPVVIACGKGNNAGDGFVIARHLDLRGHDVRVLLVAQPDELSGDAAANYRILERAGLSILSGLPPGDAAVETALEAADWIVDALLGTGARGAPRPPLDTIIHRLNASPARKLAVDLPSGLDCDTGEAAAATFRADHTCTFVAAKVGFKADTATPYLGQLHVLDIGAPRRLLEDLRTSR